MLWTLSGGTPGGGGGTGTYPAANVYDLDFRSGRSNVASINAAGFDFLRSGTAWDMAYTSYTNFTPVIDATYGLYVNPAGTNVYLQSRTPTARTIALTAQKVVVWCRGTGSVALSGAATATVTQAVPYAFSPGGSGSLTLTPSGTLSYVAVETDTLVPTLPILTTTAAVTRTAEDVRAERAAAIPQGTVAIRARSARGVGSVRQTLWEINDGGTSNRLRIDRDNTTRALTWGTVALGVATTSTVGTLADETDVLLVFAWQNGDVILKSGSFADSTGTNAIPGILTDEHIGSSDASAPFAGSLLWASSVYRIARWSTRLPNATLDAIKAGFA